MLLIKSMPKGPFILSFLSIMYTVLSQAASGYRSSRHDAQRRSLFLRYSTAEKCVVV